MSPLQHAISVLRLCLRPRRRLFVSTVATVVVFNALELAFPKLLQLYIDSIEGNPLLLFRVPLAFLSGDRGRLVLIPAALLSIAAARWGATYARSVLQTRLGQGALFDLRSRIFNTMQNLSFAYHDASHSGTLISNVVEDVNYANMFFQRGLMLLLESLTYVLISYIILFVTCPRAALASLGLFAIGAGGIGFFFKYGHAIYARTKQRYAATVQIFTENMEGHLVVKGFGTASSQEGVYGQSVDALHKAQLQERLFSSCLSQTLIWTMMFAIPLVIAVALFEAQAGRWELTSGRLFLVFYLQSGIRMRCWGLARAIDIMMQFTITAERLGKLLNSDAYLDDSGTESIPQTGPCIEVENVTFSYGDSGHSVRDVSLSVSRGETVGLVGPTGAGKSTLALLLCRFYDPKEGRVLLNGGDIRRYPLDALRNQFSLVFQDTFLFSASIRDNIAYGQPETRFEDVVNAASIAEIHDFIMSLPEGYDTVIGERGVTLSGGQRQRISIARAILRKPHFLILDACTSALDTKTEKAIQDGLIALRETTTSVIIAHRFSSIERADRVYVVEQGRIVESGTPNELNVPGTAFSRVMQS
ncbi:MAG: ABC transporter ATP-binding protein [Verrucomicrobia bacterium]|jgi:ABC-type multidrug transport system fused ATPase/permease subunit|nr:ABC transporter ATP-binding protein [Verrucomicrobiota bacterium]